MQRAEFSRKVLAPALMVFSLAPASVGADCLSNTLVPGDQTRTITHQSIAYPYDIHVPPGYDGLTPVPLVLDFHGFTSTKEAQALVSGFNAEGDAEGFIVVHPQGFGSSWNGGDFCCGLAQGQDVDDVGMAAALVAELATLGNIHHGRVYATGLSNGGALSHRIACEAADVFAASAPVSYPLDYSPLDLVSLTQCQPSRPISVAHFHGLNDTTVPYLGLVSLPFANFAPSPESFLYWSLVNGCIGGPQTSFDDGAGSTCETYTSCAAGTQVQLCSLQGGHVLYTTQTALDIADAAWTFLSRFTLPLPDADVDGIPDEDDNCPGIANPSQADADGNCVGDACEAAAVPVLAPPGGSMLAALLLAALWSLTPVAISSTRVDA